MSENGVKEQAYSSLEDFKKSVIEQTDVKLSNGIKIRVRDITAAEVRTLGVDQKKAEEDPITSGLKMLKLACVDPVLDQATLDIMETQWPVHLFAELSTKLVRALKLDKIKLEDEVKN